VQNLPANSQASRHTHGFEYACLGNYVGDLFGSQGGHIFVQTRGRNHGRAHQLHIDRGKRDALICKLAGYTARPRIQSGLGRYRSTQAWALVSTQIELKLTICPFFLAAMPG
jgi:hypothetical protein